jgi:hypothetical protein
MKNIIKNLPNSLKIYIKLMDDIFEQDNSLYERIEFVKSFLMTIISLINYFPTVLRTFYGKLDNFIRDLFGKIVINLEKNIVYFDNPDHSNLIDVAVIGYCSLLKLAPDFAKKFSSFLEKIMNNIKYFVNLIIPKTIKTKKSYDDEINIIFNKNNEKDDIIFKDYIDRSSTKLDSLNTSIKIIQILVNILKRVFDIIPNYSTVEINFHDIFHYFNTNLEKFENKNFIQLKSGEYIIDGLSSIYEFNIFNRFFTKEILKIYAYFIENYNSDLINELEFIAKIVKTFILNAEHYILTYEINIEILIFFRTIVQFLDAKSLSTVNDIIYKFANDNFISYFLKLIELCDKTVIKIDQNYFKIATIKNKKKSLIQLHNTETLDNLGIDKLSLRKLEEIVQKYLNSKIYLY